MPGKKGQQNKPGAKSNSPDSKATKQNATKSEEKGDTQSDSDFLAVLGEDNTKQFYGILEAVVTRLKEVADVSELEKAVEGQNLKEVLGVLQNPLKFTRTSSEANDGSTEKLKNEYEKRIKELQKDVRSRKDESEQLTQALRQQIEEKNKKTKELEGEKSQLSKRIQEIESENERLKRIEESPAKKEAEKEKCESSNEKTKSVIEQVPSEKSTFEKDLQQKNEECEKLRRELEKLEQEQQNHDRNMKEKLETMSKENEDKMNQLRSEHDKVIQQNKDEFNEMKRKYESGKQDRHEENESKKPKREEDGGTGKNEKTMRQLEEENEHLRTRLSQIAGSKLTDNNPSIADLSDPNRPISLGEKFSELYDNQWTDAMEVLCDDISEKEAISALLEIVCKAYAFCEKRSKSFLEDNMKALELLTKSPTKEAQKACKDYRKSVAIHAVELLQQDFCRENSKYNDKEKVVVYKKTCIQVCWFMTVQDPMVVIDSRIPKQLDTDFHKPYTKSGKNIEFLVWPVLYLHRKEDREFGPMLGKGVAQGKK